MNGTQDGDIVDSKSVNNRWKEFLGFYALAILLLALVPLLSVVLGVSMDFALIANEASETTGIPWTSNLYDVGRLALVAPGLWLLILGSFVPTLAALVMLGWGRDLAAWRAFFRRFHPVGPDIGWKEALASYALLVIGVVTSLFLIFQLRGMTSEGIYARGEILSMGLFSAILFAALLDQGAVLEEGGWRGFAMPLLQGYVLNPLLVAVVIGLAWAFWHVPRDVVSGVIDRLGYVQYAFMYLPSFTLSIISASIVAAYFMNRMGGSVIPAIMVHGIANDSMGIAGKVNLDQALTPYHQITQAVPLLVLALVVCLLSGRQLGLRRK
jgi:hypothetical protein